MRPLRVNTTEAAITWTLEVAGQHSPQTSPAHRTSRQRVETDSPSDEPVSSRSPYYIASPDREKMDLGLDNVKSPKNYYDDAESTVSSKWKRNLCSKLLAPLKKRKAHACQDQEINNGTTDRLRRLTNSKGFFAGPEASVAGSATRAAELKRMGERWMMAADAGTWLVL
ncbi:hypothetical protein B0A55_06301 [Friedmanniomyces simplex]|uniref:Uncharacterized protein n=1 Tax=Friedmanniomyces simplex TaxID=329884 RepID=A0A4U0XBV6_9PEZI|nr:hypothetical protein B0A55_06301 [Friedmanniomyces simplex]